MALQLYWFPPSSPSRAVKYLLTTSNIQFEGHLVDLMKGENKAENYLKVNPRGLIPTIQDGDFTLTER